MANKDLINTVKERIKDYIEEAIGGYVTTDWNMPLGDLIRIADNRPISTIKVEPIEWEDRNYGGKVPEDGAWVVISFIIFIFDDIDRSYEGEHPKDYKVQDHAEDLVTYLNTKRQNDTEKTTYYIHDIYEIGLGKISSRRIGRPRRLAGMEVNGKILAKWLD